MSEIIIMFCRQLIDRFLRESNVYHTVVAQVNNGLMYLYTWSLVGGAAWGGYGVFRSSLTGRSMSVGDGLCFLCVEECDQLVSHSCYCSHAVPATGDPNSVTLTMSQNKTCSSRVCSGGVIAFNHSNKNVVKTRNGWNSPARVNF